MKDMIFFFPSIPFSVLLIIFLFLLCPNFVNSVFYITYYCNNSMIYQIMLNPINVHTYNTDFEIQMSAYILKFHSRAGKIKLIE